MPGTPRGKGKAPVGPRSADDIISAVNASVSRRLLLVACFPLFFLLAAPFWWFTTSIERLPLPGERISLLENARDPPIRTKILFTADDGVFPTPPPGKMVFPKRTILEAVGKEVSSGVDGILGRVPPAARGERRWDLEFEDRGQPLRAHILLTSSANTSFPLEPYVQAPFSVSTPDDLPAGTLVIPVHPDLVDDRNLKRHYKIALINGIHNLLPDHLPGVPHRALAYSPNVTLSFVLLNEDASEGSYVDGWDIERAVRDHFLPHLEPLAPVFNFSIESQVLYHAPLTVEPHAQDGKWVIDDDQLKVFVSERWALDSGSTNNPVLRFLLFVPSAQHRPMQLGVETPAEAFLLPQFGSVVVLNPPASVTDVGGQAYRLSLAALDGAFKQYTEHLYGLLSLPPMPRELHPAPESAAGEASRAARGLADPLSAWQLDTVMRTRLAETGAEARTTLAGIVRLVDRIGEMQVGEGVRGKVLGAVRRLEGVPAAAMQRSPMAAWVLVRDAARLANEAFFDPAMMGLLYFPDQHKFAVYTPLFAPIAVSVIFGLLRELAAAARRRKARRAAAKPKPVTQHPPTIIVEDLGDNGGAMGIEAAIAAEVTDAAVAAKAVESAEVAEPAGPAEAGPAKATKATPETKARTTASEPAQRRTSPRLRNASGAR